MTIPKPGEVYFADTGTDVRHRVVVVSREELNRGKYVIALIFTSENYELRSRLKNCLPISKERKGFNEDCVAQAETIGIYFKDQLDMSEPPLTTLTDEEMQGLIRAIGYVIDADCYPGCDLT